MKIGVFSVSAWERCESAEKVPSWHISAKAGIILQNRPLTLGWVPDRKGLAHNNSDLVRGNLGRLIQLSEPRSLHLQKRISHISLDLGMLEIQCDAHNT